MDADGGQRGRGGTEGFRGYAILHAAIVQAITAWRLFAPPRSSAAGLECPLDFTEGVPTGSSNSL